MATYLLFTTHVSLLIFYFLLERDAAHPGNLLDIFVATAG
jgi:hypothetical protein